MNETTSISLPDPSQASIYQQLRSHLAELKLTAAAEALPGLLDEATASGWSTEILARIISVEIGQAESRKLASRLRFASLPTEARLDTFDLDRAKGIDRSLPNELGTCRWIETATNVLLIGPPAWGKRTCPRGWGGPLWKPDTASISPPARPSWPRAATRPPSRGVGVDQALPCRPLRC